MKFLQRIKDNLAKDRKTLKTLTFRQKIRFIKDYYKGPFFVFLCICMIGFYAWDVWMTTQRETVLEGFFTNDDQNFFPAKKLTEEITQLFQLNSDQQVLFDDSLHVMLGSHDEYHTSSQSKILAYISARELDFLVTTEELTQYYCPNVPIYDLEELLPAELLEKLDGQLYYATDGSGEYKACAVSLANCRYVKGKLADDAAPHYLIAFSYTKHPEALVRFLEYAFEEG